MKYLSVLLGALSFTIGSCGDDLSQADASRQLLTSLDALNYCSVATDCTTVPLNCTSYPINTSETTEAGAIIQDYYDTYGIQEIACPAICQLGHLECQSSKCAIVSGSDDTDPPTCF